MAEEQTPPPPPRARRTVKRSASPPPPPPVPPPAGQAAGGGEGAAGVADTTVPPPSAPVPGGWFNIATLFIFTMVAGLVVAGIGVAMGDAGRPISAWAIILATAAYPVIGGVVGKFHREPLVREQFADNCYYLGFIFTQGGLLFAFLPAVLFDKPITSETVLESFGVAIGAALIGLITRTLLIQTTLSHSDTDGLVRGEVERLARRVTEQATEVVRDFDRLSDAVARVPLAMAERLDSEVDRVVATLQRYDASLRDGLAGVEQQTLGFGQALEGAGQQQVSATRALGERLGQATNAITDLRGKLDAQSAAGLGSLEELTTVLRAGTVALGAVPEIRPVLDQVKGQIEQLQTVGPDVRAAAQGIISDLGATSSAITAEQASRLQSTSGTLDQLAARVEASARNLDAQAGRADDAARAAALGVAGRASATEAEIAELTAGFKTSIEGAVGNLNAVLIAFRDELARINSGPGPGPR